MKKLFLSSIILLIFSISALIFQISCSKNSLAQQSNGGFKQLNKVLYYLGDPNPNGSEIWIANYDGSDPQQLNIPLPQGMKFYGTARLSPDGKTIFFTLSDSRDYYSLYSGTLNGNNVSDVIKIVDGTSAQNIEDMEIYGAY